MVRVLDLQRLRHDFARTNMRELRRMRGTIHMSKDTRDGLALVGMVALAYVLTVGAVLWLLSLCGEGGETDGPVDHARKHVEATR